MTHIVLRKRNVYAKAIRYEENNTFRLILRVK